MLNIFKKIFDHEYNELNKIKVIADNIEALKDEYRALSDTELQGKTVIFKKRLEDGETLEDVLVEAFATSREASYRIIGEFPFYSQLLGALAIHFGNIAEMKTGEGKTLTGIMPAYLNALSGEGVHIVTVNEYLATRDTEWMGQIFKFLGLTVGVNKRDYSKKEKREAYLCDVLYTTNNELGFDYLRDNMVVRKEDRVLRGLNYAIIDEVDSILIDEARTPLIISGGSFKSTNLYKTVDSFTKTLNYETDYTMDDKKTTANLSDEGCMKAEKYFNLDNLYDVNNTTLVHHINQALKANYIMKKDVDYVVMDDEIVIVDPFTGRLMKGRAYSDGLHQAIEAKEDVRINEETQTLATITFQNLFRMYKKLSGMTGTAKTEEEELRNIYNMFVLRIPTNRPVIREDLADLMYSNKEGKYNAIVNEIKERHQAGQPILVGTIAVETSELISKRLTKEGIKHEVLNAKNNEREAEIIKNAGLKNSVTIATNMAGRGTDIKIDEEVRGLGGLCIIGTERHESRRIDDQLRGRSGRQGDPGVSQFFVSLEDDLMVKFGADRLKGLTQKAGLKGDMAIRSKIFTGLIENAQKRVEGYNYDTRKNVLEYDDVMNKQREIMYDKRNSIIDKDSIHEDVLIIINNYIEDIINLNTNKESKKDVIDYEKIVKIINENCTRKDIRLDEVENKDFIELRDFIYKVIVDEYENKLSKIPEDVAIEYEKAITLKVLDTYWMEHINSMAHLKEGIGLRGYAQENPLQAYILEGFNLFDNMLQRIDEQVTIYLLKSEIRQNIERKEENKNLITNDSDTTEVKKQPKKSDKVGRNELCPCGSGKKYKNCCGK